MPTSQQSVNSSSGYTWTIKEMLPFVISILIALGSVVSVYVTMSNRLATMETEVRTLKAEYATVSSKVDAVQQRTSEIKEAVNTIAYRLGK